MATIDPAAPQDAAPEDESLMAPHTQDSSPAAVLNTAASTFETAVHEFMVGAQALLVDYDAISASARAETNRVTEALDRVRPQLAAMGGAPAA